ncbi:hypothetical protein [Microbulbifer sp. JSM ZJ756]|uniref:hypothetical protein n=2 Tax=unclassified Microbulbifer TaxID=2619833 RepID=UPI0037A643D3
MKKILFLLCLMPGLTVAKVDTHFGLGLGTQYGGLAGFKFTLGNAGDRFSAGAGIANSDWDTEDAYGIALAWERLMTDQHALGAFVRTSHRDLNHVAITRYDAIQDTLVIERAGTFYETFVGGSYTYYFDSAKNSGLSAGINIGKEYTHSDSYQEFENGITWGLQIGYQF